MGVGTGLRGPREKSIDEELESDRVAQALASRNHPCGTQPGRGPPLPLAAAHGGPRLSPTGPALPTRRQGLRGDAPSPNGLALPRLQRGLPPDAANSQFGRHACPGSPSHWPNRPKELAGNARSTARGLSRSITHRPSSTTRPFAVNPDVCHLMTGCNAFSTPFLAPRGFRNAFGVFSLKAPNAACAILARLALGLPRLPRLSKPARCRPWHPAGGMDYGASGSARTSIPVPTWTSGFGPLLNPVLFGAPREERIPSPGRLTPAGRRGGMGGVGTAVAAPAAESGRPARQTEGRGDECPSLAARVPVMMSGGGFPEGGRRLTVRPVATGLRRWVVPL